ncbi:hypothetical protein GGR77_003729 [Xanthomonas translucens]
MRFLDLPSHRLPCRLDGTEGKAWPTFCNLLGTDLHMRDAQIDPLAPHYRLLRCDRRGPGAAQVPCRRRRNGEVAQAFDHLLLELLRAS